MLKKEFLPVLPPAPVTRTVSLLESDIATTETPPKKAAFLRELAQFQLSFLCYVPSYVVMFLVISCSLR